MPAGMGTVSINVPADKNPWVFVILYNETGISHIAIFSFTEQAFWAGKYEPFFPRTEKCATLFTRNKSRGGFISTLDFNMR